MLTKLLRVNTINELPSYGHCRQRRGNCSIALYLYSMLFSDAGTPTILEVRVHSYIEVALLKFNRPMAQPMTSKVHVAVYIYTATYNEHYSVLGLPMYFARMTLMLFACFAAAAAMAVDAGMSSAGAKGRKKKQWKRGAANRPPCLWGTALNGIPG